MSDEQRDHEYEQRFRSGFFTPTEIERILLRLLDVERARADAAEAKVAAVASLHHPDFEFPDFCCTSQDEDGSGMTLWPCPTDQAINPTK